MRGYPRYRIGGPEHTGPRTPGDCSGDRNNGRWLECMLCRVVWGIHRKQFLRSHIGTGSNIEEVNVLIRRFNRVDMEQELWSIELKCISFEQGSGPLFFWVMIEPCGLSFLDDVAISLIWSLENLEKKGSDGLTIGTASCVVFLSRSLQ